MSSAVAADTSPDRWIARFRTTPQATHRLVCFPYAGGGVAQYQPWGAALPTSIDLWAIKLPGRESRLQEPPAENLVDLAKTLAAVLAPHMDREVAFFGHSLGALTAFETLRALRRAGHPLPGWFFASSRGAPQLPRPDSPIHHLPVKEFLLEVIRRYDGIPRVVLQEPSLLQLLLPMLRADLKMLETYQYTDDAPLDCPIVAFGGTSDPRVTVESLGGWAAQTTGSFSVETYPGGHFYLQTERQALIDSVVGHLGLGSGSPSRELS